MGPTEFFNSLLEEFTYPPRRRSKARKPVALIVDDDHDFLELAATALTDEGFAVWVAATPGEAITWAVRHPPDVILLDILLRGSSSDGLDLLDVLRSEPETRYVPILACTALSEREVGALLPEAGFDAVIPKPVDLRRVALALRESLRQPTE